MLYRDLEKLETRMETLRANSMGARVYDMYAEAYYRPGGATESSEVSAAAKVARDREATAAARRKMGYDISDVGVVQRAKMDAEALGINAGIVPGHSKDAAGRLRRITRPSVESLRTAGVGMKTPPKVSLATARMLGLPTDRIASPGTVGIDEHGLTPSRTMEERVRNLARIRAELKEFRRDLNDAAKVETGPYKDHAADANDAAFKREVSAANKEGDELKSRKAAAKLNVEKHRIDHERKVKALARENLEFEERVFREAEDERIRKEAEHAAEELAQAELLLRGEVVDAALARLGARERRRAHGGDPAWADHRYGNRRCRDRDLRDDRRDGTQRKCVGRAFAHLAIELRPTDRGGEGDRGDDLARFEHVLAPGCVTGEAVEIANGDCPAAAIGSGDLDLRIERAQSHGHVARIGGNALIAGAENGVKLRNPVDRSAAAARFALVAGLVDIHEVEAARALAQIAAIRGLVAQLLRRSGQDGAGEHRGGAEASAVEQHFCKTARTQRFQPA